MILVNLELGIFEGDKKRALEDYVDSRAFRQRKSYDEYYCDWREVELNLDIRDLMILAENFIVTVGINDITLTVD